ncbi:AlpA family transcriptional regulator [uncultured Maricaulis sp.]|uniref:helix-turn-helix transcriptional regulator n=1 Tax=uncultured Maricaulis sp. TaxID=174710 RepID=UPI0025F739E0|nr:AlpA family phage regulatory protein [uncultured Maricaulis sp.]
MSANLTPLPLILLNQREVLERTSLSKSTLYREIAAGRFPEPLRISPNRVAWPVAVIASWIAGHAGGKG